MMECINTEIYICRICGYRTNILPIRFPECPACETPKVSWESNTTENKKEEID